MKLALIFVIAISIIAIAAVAGIVLTGILNEDTTPSPTVTPTPTPEDTPVTARIGVMRSSSGLYTVLESRRIQFQDTIEDIAAIDFSDYDILIASSMGNLAPQLYPSVILDFLSEGGVLFLGPIENGVFQEDIYPYPLNVIRTEDQEMNSYFTWIERPEHPIFSGFSTVQPIQDLYWRPPCLQTHTYGAVCQNQVFSEVDSHYDVLLSWGTASQAQSSRSPLLLKANVGDGTILISQFGSIFYGYNEDPGAAKLADNVIDYMIAETGKPAPYY